MSIELKGVNVLVDGYNLKLQRGTGIKTYGVGLIKALKLLEANVHILFSANSSESDPILNEVLFFDNQIDNFNFQSILGLVRNIMNDTIKAVCRISYKPKQLTLNNEVVIKEKFINNLIEYAEFFTLPQCYKIADIRYRIFGITTAITCKKIDIWHATYPLPIKIRKAKKITTIHDLIPIRLPYTTLDDKELFYRNVKDSIKESEIIVAVSENTKNDILTIFDITPDKICVTYEPITIRSTIINEEQLSTFLRKYKLKFRNYILFVGAIEPKKNIGRLIDAYAMIDTDMPLIIVGQKAWLWENEIGGRNLDNVHLLGHIPTDDLPYLYTGAYCFVFPSLYEGFGLPPLEAMTFGCPVIVSNVASLPEICGDAALYVEPYDSADIKDKIEHLLNNPPLRDELSKTGKERTKLFSMGNYVKRLSDVYAKIL